MFLSSMISDTDVIEVLGLFFRFPLGPWQNRAAVADISLLIRALKLRHPVSLCHILISQVKESFSQ